MEKKPAKNKRRPESKDTFKDNDKIEVSNTGSGSATAAGRGAKAIVVNFLGGWQVVITALAVLVLGGIGYFAWKQAYPEKMTGGFRIAIASFETVGDSDSSDIGKELSKSVYNKIISSLSDLQADYDIHIWSPDQVGKVSGSTSEERSISAREIAERIDANIIIYGFINATDSTWQVIPEFYVASINSFQAEEIMGQYQLGQSFSLVGQENAARRLELNTKFATRSEAISKVTIGLLYYSIRDYEKALEVYKLAENIEEWDDRQGKEVLYLLMGNAASKANELDSASEYLNKSLKIDPEYARPIITLAGIYYLQALEPFAKSKNQEDIDQQLLLKSIDTYNDALTAKNQPPLSDIPTKVHYGLGQCYFMQAYGGADVDLKLAVNEFQQVISEYGDGKNPRMRELAAESHARMGLLYVFSGNPNEASKEYQLAADLLFDNPEKQKQYQEKANEYRTSK